MGPPRSRKKRPKAISGPRCVKEISCRSRGPVDSESDAPWKRDYDQSYRIRVLLLLVTSGLPRVMMRTMAAMITKTMSPITMLNGVNRPVPGVGVGVAGGAF